MNSDIITSAPRPEDLPPLAREVREARESREAGERAGEPDAPASSTSTSMSTSTSTSTWRTALESLAHTLIRSIAAAPPLRALESFVDRRHAADDAKQQAAEAAAAAHVLRVYMQLAEGEQRMLEDLTYGGALEPVLATIIRRSEDDALDILRRLLGTAEPIVSAATLARQIGALRGELSNEEYDRIIMRLPHLSTDEQQALHSHLRAMTPADAAMVLRSYLRPRS